MLCTSCSSVDGFINSKNAYRPNNPHIEFEKNKHLGVDYSIIGSSSLFIGEIIDENSFDSYYRFFDNGRFQLLWFEKDQKIDNTLLNDINIGYIGYYYINELGEITLQFWAPIHSTNWWHWLYGKIEDDEILFTMEDSRLGFPFSKRKSLQKERIVRLKRFQPEWFIVKSEPDW